ncbi:MAG: hypothetical protein PWR06_543 [Thermoanaerobacteraceae bacterium]|jgi:hypothetical protein|nr:hypothetical protein [Thermoanaerobacteraceae bacterium]MDN5301756.1 hypothetical protein [Thermoanaerobacteraceae bacterium]MDN5312944.1 hypothetical protein [Thermoanaerobacteraceae bacterium]
MTFQTIIWMLIMLLIYFGGFVYFASIAGSREKTKSQ